MPYGGLAYFNHGPDSGKSQAHKHVQVVPLPLSREVDSPVPLQDVLDETLQGEPLGTACEMLKLPYRAYACRVDPKCAPCRRTLPSCDCLWHSAHVGGAIATSFPPTVPGPSPPATATPLARGGHVSSFMKADLSRLALPGRCAICRGSLPEDRGCSDAIARSTRALHETRHCM